MRVGGGKRSGDRFRQHLMIAEIALSFVLVATGTLLAQSLHNLLSVTMGFDAEHLVSARTWLPSVRYSDSVSQVRFNTRLRDALGACTELKPIYRRLLKMFLEELQFIDQQISKLDQELADLLSRHNDAVVHLAEIPGLGVDSAQQIIAEVGAGAATFPSAKQLSSWVGACPGDEESAEVSKSHRSPKGNRHMRRILNQAANAAVKSKGTIFEIIYRRLVSRLGHNQTIGAIAHRLCRLIWIILHRGVRYEERGPSVSAKSRRRRAIRMIRELRSLGYRVEPLATTV